MIKLFALYELQTQTHLEMKIHALAQIQAMWQWSDEVKPAQGCGWNNSAQNQPWKWVWEIKKRKKKKGQLKVFSLLHFFSGGRKGQKRLDNY